MARLNNWLMILFALPCLLPMVAIIADLYAGTESKKLIVSSEMNIRGSHVVYFSDHTSTDFSDNTHYYAWIGDTVVIDKTRLLHIIRRISSPRLDSPRTTRSHLYYFLISLLAVIPLVFAILHVYFDSKRSVSQDADSSIVFGALYFVFLSVLYFIAFLVYIFKST